MPDLTVMVFLMARILSPDCTKKTALKIHRVIHYVNCSHYVKYAADFPFKWGME